MANLVTVSGGEIYVTGRSLGSSAELEDFENGTIIAGVPPAGQTFLGWLGDTGYLSDPSIAAPSFSMVMGGDPKALSFTANFDTSPPADSVYDTINDKLDVIDANVDDLLDPL